MGLNLTHFRANPLTSAQALRISFMLRSIHSSDFAHYPQPPSDLRGAALLGGDRLLFPRGRLSY
jgi:hypothetical protein